MSDTNGKAVAAFVCGLLGLLGLLPCIGSILGIVLGRGETDGLGRAGVIMGWIGLALAAIGLLIFAGFILFGVGVAAVQNG